jgi:hypothetical protein
MPHIFFLGNYLFRMYEIHAQYNWMFPLHIIFFFFFHLRPRPYFSAKQGDTCLPCTSSFPVHVAMSLLHESCSHHLQTLSHAVHPSVAQKDKNILGQWSGIIRNCQEKRSSRQLLLPERSWSLSFGTLMEWFWWMWRPDVRQSIRTRTSTPSKNWNSITSECGLTGI